MRESNDEDEEDLVGTDEELACIDAEAIGESLSSADPVCCMVVCAEKVDRKEGTADIEDSIDTLESSDGAEEEDLRGVFDANALCVLSTVGSALDVDDIEARVPEANKLGVDIADAEAVSTLNRELNGDWDEIKDSVESIDTLEDVENIAEAVAAEVVRALGECT